MKYNIQKIDIVDSTHYYTLNLRGNKEFKEGLVISTNFQTNGQGQRGSSWDSQKGKNILFSVVFQLNISIKKHFDISKLISLALIRLLNNLNIDAKIKWPNDILVEDKKIAGILINNIISKDIISHSVIGIGLNVNQDVFNEYFPKATSIFLETSYKSNLEKIQCKLLKEIKYKIENYRKGNNMYNEYLYFLYKRDEVAFFESDFQKFNAIIRGVTDLGLLIVEKQNEIRNFDIKELRMLF